MKKECTILLLIMSFALMNGVFAQPSGKPKPHGMEPLDLTEEQIEKIQDLHLELEKNTLALKSKMHSLEAELKQELIAEKFSQVKVKNLFEQKGNILVEMELAHFMNQRAIRDLLTPQQCKKFDLQTLREHMGYHPMRPMPMRPPESGMNPRHRGPEDMTF